MSYELLLFFSSCKKKITYVFVFLPIFSESPTNGEYNCAPLIDKNATLAEDAITLTRVVLLQPGGPYNRIPLGGFNPSFLNESLYSNGHSTACFNLYFRQ